MKKRKVLIAHLHEPVKAAPVFGADTSITPEKFETIEMYTGEDPGFLTVKSPQLPNKLIGIPYGNIKNLIWDVTEEEK